MSTPYTAVSASTPRITEQRVVFFTCVISKRSVSRSFIDQRDRAVFQFRQGAAVDNYEAFKR